MAEKRKTSTAECTCEAVRLVTEPLWRGGSRPELRSNTNRLRRWKRALAESKNGVFPGKGRLSPTRKHSTACSQKISACGWTERL